MIAKIETDMDWHPFDNGKTIGTKGAEEGIILIDIENTNGARITLEKETMIAPYAITLGIYGLMFHTHFESALNMSEEYVARSKHLINKVFALYDTPEDKRDGFWNDEHDKLLHEIADMA